MSVRTLYRRLSDNGQTYARIVDEVRFQRAKQLLASPDVSIADVSGAVGFDDPAHFSRMFRRVGGLSPRAYRNWLP